MDYKGVIIEESLEDTSVIKGLKILGTKIEQVTEKHKTPWIKQWTLDTILVPEAKASLVAEKISHALDAEHTWYADFKSNSFHYIIFRDKVFYVNRKSKEEYDEVKRYGISLGIPDYQLDFSPVIN